MISRRDFGTIVLAGVPMTLRSRALADTVGVDTHSFRELARTPGQDNVDDVIRALKFTGARLVVLASANTEPAGPNSGPAAPPTPSVYPSTVKPPSPEEVAAARLAVRNALRQWRLSTAPANHEAVRAKFQAAGIDVFAYRVDYDSSFTDDEIDATFRQAKALGAGVIASMTSLNVARRLAPFADRHGITLALHNSVNIKNADSIASPQSLGTALRMSKRFRLNFDIGNFTAANGEALAYLQENYGAISHVQLTDRTRNGGGHEKLGDGDTPIRDVLALIRKKQLDVPVIVDYEYIGLGTPQEEVRKCLAFARAGLA